MGVFAPAAIRDLTDIFINKVNDGTIIFYQTGSMRPRYVGHALTQGCIPVLGFNLGNPSGVMNMNEGRLYFNLEEQIISYPNYCVPDCFRIFTNAGLAVYQGNAAAWGREPNSSSIVNLVSKMLHDEYVTPEEDTSQFATQYSRLPPNYKCTLSNFSIRII